MVWGGRLLGEALHKTLPTDENYGESWEVSDHPLHESRVSQGPLAGQTLRNLMEQAAPDLLGPAATSLKRFPWLIKFLDARDWLSVQVHPDDTKAARLWPGEGGKTEAWFVLDAAPGSRIFAGLKAGVGESQLRKALAAGTVAECLHSFAPRPGDCLFLPAGTVHAVGGGVLMAEVQQTSDATFRLFDWNRRDAQGQTRKLHIEEAIACIDWTRGPVSPVRTEVVAKPPARTGSRRQTLVSCPFFALEYCRINEPLVCGGSGHLQALIVLDGRGKLDGAGELALGQVWVLPASLPAVRCLPEPELSLLLCTLP
jgi:mannose-6-phosphate isomerase